MAQIHAQIVGEQALVPRAELERLVELARHSEDIELQWQDQEDQKDDVPAVSLMRLAEQGGAFDWLADEEDLYTTADLKVCYHEPK